MSLPVPPAPDTQEREPARKIGAVVSVATAVIGAAVVFGADDQKAQALLGVVAAIAAAAPLLTSLWIRRKVFSPATVAELLKRQAQRR